MIIHLKFSKSLISTKNSLSNLSRIFNAFISSKPSNINILFSNSSSSHLILLQIALNKDFSSIILFQSRNLKTIILSSSLYSFAIHEIILDFPIPGTPLISIVEVLSLSTNFFIISSNLSLTEMPISLIDPNILQSGIIKASAKVIGLSLLSIFKNNLLFQFSI